MTKYFHLVARARAGRAVFGEREVCQAMWRILRRHFKRTLGCVLMPDHLHLLVEWTSGEGARQELALAIAALGRSRFRRQSPWEPLPLAEPIRDLQHLKRQIRYVHLNPCRKGLASDPLEWEWSTHRDAIGACGSPWLDVATVARGWRCLPSAFPREFHAYVSGDPTVRVEGTALPEVKERFLVSTPTTLELALVQATRARADARLRRSRERRLMIHLAERMGAPRRSWIAAWIGVSRRAVVYALAKKPTPADESALRAARLILAAPARFEPAVTRGVVLRKG